MGIDDRPAGIQGVSLLPLMHGKTTHGSPLAFSEATYVGKRRSIRRADGKKLIRSLAGEPDQLFELGQDPEERKNLLAGEAAAPDVLVNQLSNWARNNEDRRTELFSRGSASQEVILDTETRERLEALGYIPAETAQSE